MAWGEQGPSDSFRCRQRFERVRREDESALKRSKKRGGLLSRRSVRRKDIQEGFIGFFPELSYLRVRVLAAFDNVRGPGSTLERLEARHGDVLQCRASNGSVRQMCFCSVPKLEEKHKTRFAHKVTTQAIIDVSLLLGTDPAPTSSTFHARCAALHFTSKRPFIPRLTLTQSKTRLLVFTWFYFCIKNGQ